MNGGEVDGERGCRGGGRERVQRRREEVNGGGGGGGWGGREEVNGGEVDGEGERGGERRRSRGGGGEKRSVYKALNIDWCWSRIPAFPPLKNFLFAKPILYIHTHIHTYTHTHLHTHIRTYIHNMYMDFFIKIGRNITAFITTDYTGTGSVYTLTDSVSITTCSRHRVHASTTG